MGIKLNSIALAASLGLYIKTGDTDLGKRFARVVLSEEGEGPVAYFCYLDGSKAPVYFGNERQLLPGEPVLGIPSDKDTTYLEGGGPPEEMVLFGGAHEIREFALCCD